MDLPCYICSSVTGILLLSLLTPYTKLFIIRLGLHTLSKERHIFFYIAYHFRASNSETFRVFGVVSALLSFPLLIPSITACKSFAASCSLLQHFLGNNFCSSGLWSGPCNINNLTPSSYDWSTASNVSLLRVFPSWLGLFCNRNHKMSTLYSWPKPSTPSYYWLPGLSSVCTFAACSTFCCPLGVLIICNKTTLSRFYSDSFSLTLFDATLQPPFYGCPEKCGATLQT